MGEIRKVGDTYYVEFCARGLMYSQVAGTDLAAARALLESIEKKIAAGEALTIVRDIDLLAFFDQFMDFIRQGYDSRTVRRFESLAGHFQQFVQQRKTALGRSHPETSAGFGMVSKLSQVTPGVVEAYKAYLVQTAKPRLVNFSILLLREIMEHGIKLGFINDNPTVHVRLLPWTARHLRQGQNHRRAESLLAQPVSLLKVYALLGLRDIAQIMHYANSIPLQREEMYN